MCVSFALQSLFSYSCVSYGREATGTLTRVAPQVSSLIKHITTSYKSG